MVRTGERNFIYLICCVIIVPISLNFSMNSCIRVNFINFEPQIYSFLMSFLLLREGTLYLTAAS